MIWVGDGPGDTQPPHGAMLDQQEVHPVRSVTVRAPAHALRLALEATLPPGAETAETPQAAETWSAGGGIITFKGAAALVIAAIQERGDGTSAAHVVTTDADLAARRALCEWAALVRDHLAAAVLP
jgi:hypothetical protein